MKKSAGTKSGGWHVVLMMRLRVIAYHLISWFRQFGSRSAAKAAKAMFFAFIPPFVLERARDVVVLATWHSSTNHCPVFCTSGEANHSSRSSSIRYSVLIGAAGILKRTEGGTEGTKAVKEKRKKSKNNGRKGLHQIHTFFF